MNRTLIPLAALLLAALAGCGADNASTATDSKTSRGVPTPTPNPADFVAVIDNPYLPMAPGTSWVYEVTSADGGEQITVTVTDERKVVAGVPVTVVRDTVRDEEGALVEDTFDWYAQDTDGNVWYFGEDTKAYDGDTVSTEGSWEAGVDGARAGIVMLADPRAGRSYRQEYYEGHAEDEAKVLATDAEVTVPFGSYTEVVQTEDRTPLEPDILEHKFYAKGVGTVFEKDVSGGDEVVRLVRMTKG